MLNDLATPHSANSASSSLITVGVSGLDDPFIIAGERDSGDLSFGESSCSSGVLKKINARSLYTKIMILTCEIVRLLGS